MKITMKTRSNFQTEAAKAKVKAASKKALLKVTTEIAEQAKKPWPDGTPYLTGNNSRSILFDVDGGNLTAMVYSTSGYGGYLEVGTVKRPTPRPYLKPALDKFLPTLMKRVKEYL